MYSVLDYSAMMRDSVRMEAYKEALRRVITPDSVVVDIGAGTGIASLIAARLGARRVHAIESNPSIHLLSELAAENGFGSRIQVHAESSLLVELPEPADVIVSDLRGSFPLYGIHLAIVRDARRRFLRAGGVMIPARDQFFVAGFESYEVARRLALASDGFDRHGFKSSAAHRSVRNSVHRDADLTPIAASDLLTTAARWSEVDYATWPGPVLEGSARVEVSRAGMLHGLVVWFRANLDGTITYENSPGMQLAYSRVVLPLDAPLRMAPGQAISVTLRVDESGERWAWNVTTTDDTGREHSLRQASFLGATTSPAELMRNATSFVPERNWRAEIAAFLLQNIDGKKSVKQLEQLVLEAFPERPRESVALEVRDAVRRYSR